MFNLLNSLLNNDGDIKKLNTEDVMKMKVVELSKFEKRKASWSGSQPFSMAFCYPKSGPILIKGMSEEVYNYIDKKVGPCHYRMVHFGFGDNRGFWRFNVKNIYLHLQKQRNDHQRYELTMYKNHKEIKKIIRKVPLKYIKEIDFMLED